MRKEQDQSALEQRLEAILDALNLSPAFIAYFANGAGLSLYLTRKYRGASFELVNFSRMAPDESPRLKAAHFDLVFSVRVTPTLAYLRELTRICKPDGHVFLIDEEILELHKR